MIRKDVISKITSEAPLQTYTTEELAFLYNVNPKTLLRWIAPFKEIIGNKIGWFYNIKQVKVIFQELGRPEKVN